MWWKPLFLTRLFRRPLASRVAAARTTARWDARRFRPSLLVLEDRTVPSGSDLFATATELTGTSITDTGSNIGATGETGDPDHAGVSADLNGNLNSVWWKWTAPADGIVTVDTVGSDFDTTLAVYTGESFEDLTPQAENNDIAPPDQFPDNPDLRSRVTFDVVGGTTYYIAVDGSQDLTGQIQLNLSLPVANSPPEIGDQSFSVDENSAAGTVVGKVLATDPDAGQMLSYSIAEGNESGVFAINASTGVITVANSAALNFEAASSFALTVEVIDTGVPSLTASATVTVTVTDVNEAVVFGSSGPFSVDENSSAGTTVGVVTATDPDGGQTLTYAITRGNASGAFAIDADGRITVANPAALNFEVTPSFTLTVEVTDSGSPALTAATTVTVNLNDVNDAPVLDNTGSMSLAAINQSDAANAGTLVSDILASAGGNRVTDEDAGALRGIAVIGADTANGTWQFSTDGGATWSDIGEISDSSALLLAADANTRVRFVPAAGFNGTVTGGITFRAWDQTSGVNGGLGDASVNGGSTAFSTAAETASVHVRSVFEQLDMLEAEVQSLVAAGVLTPAQGNNLEGKLENARRKYEQGNADGAVKHLRAFINQVEDYVRDGTLTAAQGESLTAKANGVIGSMTS